MVTLQLRFSDFSDRSKYDQSRKTTPTLQQYTDVFFGGRGQYHVPTNPHRVRNPVH